MKLELSSVLPNKAIVNVFDNGNVTVQGQNSEPVKAILGASAPAVAEPAAKYSVKRKVFVVYGPDQTCRNQLEAMLRGWGLEPLILDQ